MHLRRGMFLVLCLCLLSVGAFADSVTAQFTIDVNGNPVPARDLLRSLCKATERSTPR